MVREALPKVELAAETNPSGKSPGFAVPAFPPAALIGRPVQGMASYPAIGS